MPIAANTLFPTTDSLQLQIPAEYSKLASQHYLISKMTVLITEMNNQLQLAILENHKFEKKNSNKNVLTFLDKDSLEGVLV